MHVSEAPDPFFPPLVYQWIDLSNYGASHFGFQSEKGLILSDILSVDHAMPS